VTKFRGPSFSANAATCVSLRTSSDIDLTPTSLFFPSSFIVVQKAGLRTHPLKEGLFPSTSSAMTRTGALSGRNHLQFS